VSHSYIIETCHEAASVAHHARRAKIKLDDFKFMLRRDTTKLGRVSEMMDKDKMLKQQRKAFDTDEGTMLAKDDGSKSKRGREGGGEGGDAGESGGKGGKDGGVAGKARSEAGSKRDAGGGGPEDGERKKKKRKKNKDRVGDGGSVASL
jgi:transcription initiation factor TFIID subunit 13